MGRLLLNLNFVFTLLLIISFTVGFPKESSIPGHSISLRSLVLEGLGLSKIPDMSKVNISQEEYSRMYRVYLKSVEDNRKLEMKSSRMDSNLHSTVQRLLSFRHTDKGSDHVESALKATRLYFPLTLNKADIEKATLKMFASIPSNTFVRLTVQIYQLLERGKRLVGSQRIDFNSSRWIDFDVTEVVESWNDGQSKNLGLEVRCLTNSNRSVILLTDNGNRGNASTAPALNVLVNERISAIERRKRSDEADEESFPDMNRRTDCSKDNHRQRCCRHTMEVVFKDLPGFEFIIQPFRFDAGYCKGRCPPRYNPAHHHAVIQSLMWKKDKTRTPRPCCSPSKLANLEILHVDEKNPSALKVSTWKNMRVLECACS